MKNLFNKLFTKYYLKIVHPDDVILLKKNGQVFIDGKQIIDTKLKGFIEDAQLLRSNRLLRSILNTMRAQAENNILYKGTTQEIVHNNRITLHVLNQLESMVNIFKSYDDAIKRQKEFLNEFDNTEETSTKK